jgi:Putative auto-transporter adhesin, head GIN domain
MNMKKSILIATAVISVWSFSSCRKVTGEGPLEIADRSVSNFSTLSSAISGNVYFTQSAQYKVRVQAQRNILDVIETYTAGSELIVKFRNNVNVRSHDQITVWISAPQIDGLRVSGPGNVTVTGNFTPVRFNAAVSGSGSLAIDSLKIADALTTAVSGSGSLKIIQGQAKTADVFVSGSGSNDISGVKTDKADVHISGSGNAKVYPLQTLEAHISGSGNVFYFGNPVIQSHISGSGAVIKM